jgi:hypothetical protein
MYNKMEWVAVLHKNTHCGGEVDVTGSWSFQGVYFGVKPCWTLGFCSTGLDYLRKLGDATHMQRSVAAMKFCSCCSNRAWRRHSENGAGRRHLEPDLRNYHNLSLWPQPQTPKLFFPHTDFCGLQTGIHLPVYISHADIIFGLHT